MSRGCRGRDPVTPGRQGAKLKGTGGVGGRALRGGSAEPYRLVGDRCAVSINDAALNRAWGRTLLSRSGRGNHQEQRQGEKKQRRAAQAGSPKGAQAAEDVRSFGESCSSAHAVLPGRSTDRGLPRQADAQRLQPAMLSIAGLRIAAQQGQRGNQSLPLDTVQHDRDAFRKAP
jgi:hypothetical protein